MNYNPKNLNQSNMNNISEKDFREFNQNLKDLNKRLSNFWLNLGKGFLTGFGSVLGAGVAIILIGWFLNVIGVIPAFQQQAEQWKDVFIQTSNPETFLSPEDTPTPAE